MRVHLILKPKSGATLPASALPTAATIKEFLASSDTVDKVQKTAADLGFKVVVASPLQVTIEGTKASFEKAFGSRLCQRSGASSKGGRKASGSVSKKPSSKSSKTGDLAWESPPRLPAELKDAVSDVVLPQATALHRS